MKQFDVSESVANLAPRRQGDKTFAFWRHQPSLTCLSTSMESRTTPQFQVAGKFQSFLAIRQHFVVCSFLIWYLGKRYLSFQQTADHETRCVLSLEWLFKFSVFRSVNSKLRQHHEAPIFLLVISKRCELPLLCRGIRVCNKTLQKGSRFGSFSFISHKRVVTQSTRQKNYLSVTRILSALERRRLPFEAEWPDHSQAAKEDTLLLPLFILVLIGKLLRTRYLPFASASDCWATAFSWSKEADFISSWASAPGDFCAMSFTT